MEILLTKYFAVDNMMSVIPLPWMNPTCASNSSLVLVPITPFAQNAHFFFYLQVSTYSRCDMSPNSLIFEL